MKTVLCSLLAAVCLVAPAARGAVLGYSSAYRYLECGAGSFETTDPFGDLDRALTGQDSLASQRSALGASTITVSSRISGTSERGAAFFKISFSIATPAEWTLTGSFELLGSAGFACVSLQDLAHLETLMVNEIIYAPPHVSEVRTLQFGGVLSPGSYSLEAMIYGGGDNQFTRGGIDAVFSIPEPDTPLLLLALLIRVRRR